METVINALVTTIQDEAVSFILDIVSSVVVQLIILNNNCRNYTNFGIYFNL